MLCYLAVSKRLQTSGDCVHAETSRLNKSPFAHSVTRKHIECCGYRSGWAGDMAVVPLRIWASSLWNVDQVFLGIKICCTTGVHSDVRGFGVLRA